jgi:hypothetical protein
MTSTHPTHARRHQGATLTAPASTQVGDRQHPPVAPSLAATPSWTRSLAAAVLVAGMVTAAAVAYLPFRSTPDPVGSSAPAGVFSAVRAMDDLRSVASSPRPMGSAEHAETLQTIADRLTDLGVKSEFVEGVVARPDFNQVFAARLRNLIARIPGTNSSGAVLLMSHFDSVPTSSNANDGGLGVATILETVRAIQAGPALENDVVLWFGDADETTAINARLLQRHPWFDDVRLALAFEGVGVRGPSLLTFSGQGNPGTPFEDPAIGENEGASLSNPSLTTDNGRWLREALAAVPHPVLALALNDLAIGVSPDAGMAVAGNDVAAVTFTQIGDSSGYHTDLDRPDRVSPRSLQDSGDTALALTRHFGAYDFNASSDASSLVAFNLLPGWIVSYPTTWVLPLALVVLVLLAAVLVVGKRRGELTITGVLLGLALTLLALALSVVAAVIATNLLAPDVHFARNPYGLGWRLLFLAALTLAGVAAVFLAAGRLLRKPARITATAAGPLVVLAALTVLTAKGTLHRDQTPDSLPLRAGSPPARPRRSSDRAAMGEGDREDQRRHPRSARTRRRRGHPRDRLRSRSHPRSACRAWRPCHRCGRL